jgi:DNA invertase Pin-like site-specific DNA recombinase
MAEEQARAAIYARCSTDERRQDVDVQLAELRRYCQVYGWSHDEVWEYDSGFKGQQPKLKALLERIRRQQYQVLLVYSLDRLSRQAPSRTNRLLDELVERDRCRFISRLEGIDSDNELTWNVVRPIFAYFANLYSRNLSERIRAGIAVRRQKGLYRGGRPARTVDLDRLRDLCRSDGYGWRRLTRAYNEGLARNQQVSVGVVRRVCQKHSLRPEHGNGAN